MILVSRTQLYDGNEVLDDFRSNVNVAGVSLFVCLFGFFNPMFHRDCSKSLETCN